MTFSCVLKVHFIVVMPFGNTYVRHVPKGEAGGAYAPPDFGRLEGAAGQRRHAALLLAPPTFRKLLTPLLNESNISCTEMTS